MTHQATQSAGSHSDPVLDGGKRLRLGIWGLGRGMNFYKTCAALNIDVVAGCDFNAHMRENFKKQQPDARVTEDAAEFLSWDFDAVLLATFCPNHADDAIAALAAGKHVLSEVTSFHTLAEGVRLVETVEKSGKVYNLAENYPFSAPNMWLAARWRQGLFGELMYGEYSYIHEIRTLQYTYIDGVPIEPGWQVHNWRTWINGHYYNTHSLGPIMIITGLRPTRVVSLRSEQNLPGYVMRDPAGKWGIPCPSLVKMSNHGLVRNLMGAMTDDTNIQRLWGTRGASEWQWNSLKLRLGGGGETAKFEVKADWPDPALAELARRTGHGGGDFWVLYYFARQIHTGQPAPFDIYTAADCTLQGILGYRSSQENGQPYDIPDFRDPKQRDHHRNDHRAQKRYDVEHGAFGGKFDRELAGQFNTAMKHLDQLAKAYSSWSAWAGLVDDMKEPAKVLDLTDKLSEAHAQCRPWLGVARRIADAHPETDAARVINELLDLCNEPVTTRPDFADWLKDHKAQLAAKISKATAQV